MSERGEGRTIGISMIMRTYKTNDDEEGGESDEKRERRRRTFSVSCSMLSVTTNSLKMSCNEPILVFASL